MLLVVLWIAIQSSFVQARLVAYATNVLREQLKTDVRIGKVDLRLFNRIVLKDLFVADLRGDTLLAASKVSASLLKVSLRSQHIKFNRVTLNDAKINFLYDSTGVLNLTQLLASFKKDTLPKSDSSMAISFRHISLENSNFCMIKHSFEPKPYGVNFNNLQISNINLDVENLSIKGDTIAMTIEGMRFKEASGLVVNTLRADLSLSSSYMHFERLRLNSHGTSLQLSHLGFSYNGWDKMGDFLNAVKIDAVIDRSVVSTRFISFFAPDLNFLEETIKLQGVVRGTISDIRVRSLQLAYGRNTFIESNFNITGLPDFDNSFLHFDIRRLTSTANDLRQVKNVQNGKALVQVPKEIDNLGKISFTGNFSGYISNFVTFGTVATDVGTLRLDLAIRPDARKNTNFKGDISTGGINLGKLIGSEAFGSAKLMASVKGVTHSKGDIEANTDAFIQSFEANGYRYSNIKIAGKLSSKSYSGSVIVDDPNAKVNFLGKVDFSDSVPVFDFSAFVPKFDLVKTYLNPIDSISQASFLLTAKLTGSTLDNSKGEVKVVNTIYRNQNGEVKTADISIVADNSIDSKLITVKSEFAHAELRGKYNYASVFGMLSRLAYRYIPALNPDNTTPTFLPTGVENPEFNDYIIRLRVKKAQKLLDVVSPGMKVAENTNLFGIFNPDLQSLNVKIKIPEVAFGTTSIKDISIDGETTDSTFIANITTPIVSFGSNVIRNIAINASAYNNKIRNEITWDNRQTSRNQGGLKTTVSFLRESVEDRTRIKVNLHPSQFFLNDTSWRVMSSYILIDSSAVKIKNISVINQSQHLRVTGMISENPKDSIMVELNRINLSNVNFYTKELGYQFDGLIYGKAIISSILKQPLLVANISIPKLLVNNQTIGYINLHSQWYGDEEKLAIEFSNSIGDTLAMQIKGSIFPESKKILVNADIKRLNLSAFEPLLDGNVTGLAGYLSGNVSVGGTFERPEVNGVIVPNRAQLTVDFLKTQYRFIDPITIDRSNMVLNNFRVFDVNNRLALVNGRVDTDFFRNISLNLSLAPNNFQLMNTQEKDNELFYGSVYASGTVQIGGRPDDINMYVSIRTEPRTAIFLPLSTSSSAAEYNFVNFMSSNDNIFIVEEEIALDDIKKTNLSLTLDLEITPDAEAQIIIDKTLGDIIRANGSGKLKMDINPSQDKFRMFGDYVIEKGDYLFNLQGTPISKKFKIAEGSSINWNGDVTDASMNIQAIYSLRTTLHQLLLTQDNEKFKKRTPVDCQILLSGKLMEPTIKFNIEVPGADSETSALVQSALNTDEKISQQFLGLLIIGSFIADPAVAGRMSSTQTATTEGGGLQQGLSNTVGELLSNQLSNWMSQWSNNFDFGINYRPGEQLSSNELEVAMSTQLFNDRVTINGNVDMGNQNTSSPIAGDFSIDVKLNPSGKVRAKAFARSNDDLLYQNQSTHTTGAGIVYREDFNTLSDLWDRFKNIFKPKAKPQLPETENGNGNGNYKGNREALSPNDRRSNKSYVQAIE